MLYFLLLRLRYRNLFMNFCLFFVLYVGFYGFTHSLYTAEEKEHLKASSAAVFPSH